MSLANTLTSPRNVSTSISVTDQQDIVRSILILQQQQQQQQGERQTDDAKDERTKARGDAEPPMESLKPSVSDAIDSEGSHSTQSTMQAGTRQLPRQDTNDIPVRELPGSTLAADKPISIERDVEDTFSKRTVFSASDDVVESAKGCSAFESSDGSVEVAPLKYTTTRLDYQHRDVPLDSHSSQNTSNSNDLRPGSLSVVKEAELRIHCIDMQLSWWSTELKISEDKIQEILARNHANGNSSAAEVIQSLPGSQRQIVANFLEDIEFEDCESADTRVRVSLVLVRHTEEDL